MSINELWAILGARNDVATADLPAAEIIGHSREGRSLHFVIAASHGIGDNDVVAAATRLMGFNRAGQALRQRFSEVLEQLIEYGVVERRDGQVHLAEGA